MKAVKWKTITPSDDCQFCFDVHGIKANITNEEQVHAYYLLENGGKKCNYFVL